jgi:hypothetical protein
MSFPTTLPGEFAIRTQYTFNYVSYSPATGGSDASFNTLATSITPTEKFKITTWYPGYSLIRTFLDGNYVAVGNPGGIVPSPTGPGSVLNQPQLFTLVGPNQGLGNFQIEVNDGSYLIAAEGGGETFPFAFLTDVPPDQYNPYFANFSIVKCGDLGNGYKYAIRAAPSLDPRAPVSFTNFLTAVNGGGKTQNGVTARNNGLTSEAIFTLIRMSEPGQYALQTSDGFNYVTAVDGGGLADGDNLHTDATRIAGWENFQIVDQLDGTYAIQTVSGFYLAVATPEATLSGADISTRISSPDLAPEIGYTAKFEFIMIPNQMEIIGC